MNNYTINYIINSPKKKKKKLPLLKNRTFSKNKRDKLDILNKTNSKKKIKQKKNLMLIYYLYKKFIKLLFIKQQECSYLNLRKVIEEIFQ